jgi:CheY-like chemotaxis protein
MKNILVLEDNPSEEEWLSDTFQPPGYRLEFVRSESAFYARLEQGELHFDLVMLDVMARWADPAPVIPRIPEVVRTQGYYYAGIRCADKLLSISGEKPILFYTIVNEKELQRYITREYPPLADRKIPVVPKGSDQATIAAQIESLIAGTTETTSTSSR